MSLISLSPSAIGGLRPAPAFHQPAGDRLSHAAFTALSVLVTAGAAIADHWHDRQRVRWLANADDAVLRDLGIARSDIPRLVRHGRH
jgi:uncharacterized protein YjiS (DUF1127 family)